MVLLERKVVSMHFLVFESKPFAPIHYAGLCSDGPWTMDMKSTLWLRDPFNKTFEVHKHSLKNGMPGTVHQCNKRS